MSDALEKAAKEHADQVVKTECKVAGNKGCLLTDVGETILRAEAERSFKAGWQASQEWRPISSAPKDINIFVSVPTVIYPLIMKKRPHCFIYEGQQTLMQPTHWMPLPNPPKSEETKMK